MFDSLELLSQEEHPTTCAPALDDRFAPPPVDARHADEEEEEIEDDSLEEDEEEDDDFDDDLDDEDDLDDDLDEDEPE